MLAALVCVGLVDYLMVSAVAQVGPSVPEVNVLEQLGQLVIGWSALGAIAKASAFVLITVQVMKQASFKYKRIAVIVMSIVYGVLQLVIGGESPVAASMAVLVSGGGAVALYNALKPLLKKVKFLSFLDLGKE